MNATMEVNTHLLQFIEDLQKQVFTLSTTNISINQGTNDGPPNPKFFRNPSNSSNTQDFHRCNTRKDCWLRGD